MSSVDNRTINIEDRFKQKIEDLWANNTIRDDNILQRGFLAPRILEKNSILFLGINPSYTKNSSTNDYKNKFYEPQTESKATFYKKMRDLTLDLNIGWCHLDILFIRETLQKNVHMLLKEVKYRKFFEKHLEITKRIIEYSHPEVIVVSNALTRDLMGHHDNYKLGMRFDFEFDESIGTERIITKGNVLENTPIFFTSMLSGQRALDIGSFKRLKWHIGNVISNLN